MNPDAQDSADRNARLEQVLAEYLRAAEAGTPRDRQQIIDQHPDLADELRSFFANRAALDRIAGSAFDATMDASANPQSAIPNPPSARVRYFGDYELLEELGRGGMGVVYKARQTTLNRLVALKLILAGELASADDVQRFRQEAEAAANLDHPNIAPIYETGEHNGQQYFSMKLIEGDSRLSLRETTFFRGAKGDNRAIELLAAVSRAVHHAHQRGVLHRDLKPGNILLDKVGTAYVTDFGLAKRVEGDSDVTRTGAIVGTPSYMAPEQARAEKVLTTAVDVYSLGAMLYELLTGRPPFREDSPVKTLLKSLSSEPPRPKSINPAADRDLETIALKCLEKDAAKRYDSAAALADDLDRWLAGKPIAARPVSSWERGRKWARRNPLVATLAASLVLLLVAGVAGVVWQWRQAVEQRALAVARAAENQQRIVHQYVANGANALDRDRPLEAMTWFAEALQLEGPDAALQEPHRRRLGALGGQIPRLAQVFAHDQHAQAAFSPDGRHIATWSGKKVWLWDAESGRPRCEPLDQPDSVWNVTFSSDSQRIVVACNPMNLSDPRNYSGTIGVFETAGGRAVGAPRPVPLLNAWHVQFTPDGQRVLFSADKRIELRDAATWQEAWPAIEHRLRVRWLAMSPHGRRLLANFGEIEAENEVQLFDATTGRPTPTAAAVADHEFGMDSPFSPDDRYFATFACDPTGGRGDGPTQIQLWDTDTGKSQAQVVMPRAVRRLLLVGREPIVVAHLNDERLYFCSPLADDPPAITHWQQPIWSFTVSPEGQRIAVQRRDNWSIVLVNREILGGLLAEFPIATAADQINFSPDGQRLAVSARGPEARQGTVHLIDLNSQEHVALAVGHLYGQMTTAFSSDGRRMLSADEDGIVRTWDVTTLGSSLRPCQGLNDQGVSVLELSPSERWLAIGQGHHDMAVERGGAEPFGLLRVWNLADGVPVGPELKFGWRVEAIRFSDDERQAMVMLSDGSAVLVNVVTGERLEEFAGGKDGISLAVISSARTRESSVQSRGSLREPTLDRGAINDNHDSLDRSLTTSATTTSATTVVLQGTQRRIGYGFEPLPPGRIERRRSGLSSPLSSIAIGEHQLARLTPRGDRVLVVWPDREAVLLDAATGEETQSLGNLHGHIRQAEFSRDGRRLALLFDDEIAELWDVDRARISARLIRGVEVVRFSHRGTELLTGKEGVFRVWDAATGEPLSGLYRVAAAVQAPRMAAVPALGPNANTLLSTAGDRLREWPLAPDDRPVDRLVELAQVVSGHGVDDVGGYASRPLSARSRTRESLYRSLTTSATAAWHEREAWQCEMQLPAEPFRGSERIPAWGVREHVSALLAEHPDGRLFSRRGTAHLLLGDGPAAVADFTAAIERGLDSDPLVYLRRGRANELAGNHDAAVADLARAFELGQRELPEPTAKWERLAAIRGLARRLERQPDDWPSLELRADLAWQVRDFAACLNDLDRLQAAGRVTYFLPYRRAWCLSEIGRGEEAIAAFTQNLGDKEDDPAELEGRAYAHAKLGQFTAAADDMKKARRLYAYPYQTWRREAVMRLLAGDQAGYRQCCAETWQAAQSNYGDDPRRAEGFTAAEVACTCVLAADGIEDLAAVVALARQGVRHDPGAAADPRFAAHTLALALCRQKQFDESLAALSKLVKHGSANALTLALKALVLHHQTLADDARQALAAAEREFADPRVYPRKIAGSPK